MQCIASAPHSSMHHTQTHWKRSPVPTMWSQCISLLHLSFVAFHSSASIGTNRFHRAISQCALPSQQYILDPNAQSTVTVWSASLALLWWWRRTKRKVHSSIQLLEASNRRCILRWIAGGIFRSCGCVDSIIMHCTLRQDWARLPHRSLPKRQPHGFRSACACPFSYTRQFICAHLLRRVYGVQRNFSLNKIIISQAFFARLNFNAVDRAHKNYDIPRVDMVLAAYVMELRSMLLFPFCVCVEFHHLVLLQPLHSISQQFRERNTKLYMRLLVCLCGYLRSVNIPTVNLRSNA